MQKTLMHYVGITAVVTLVLGGVIWGVASYTHWIYNDGYDDATDNVTVEKDAKIAGIRRERDDHATALVAALALVRRPDLVQKDAEKVTICVQEINGALQPTMLPCDKGTPVVFPITYDPYGISTIGMPHLSVAGSPARVLTSTAARK